jgi:septum formation topological specificity factor MinE
VPALARDRRERWWQAVPGSSVWSFLDFADPEARAVADLVKAQMVIDEFQRLRRFEQNRDSWSQAWLQAVMSSDSFLRLTPPELAELTGELLAVLTRWAQITRERPLEGERQPVSVFFHAFPEQDR